MLLCALIAAAQMSPTRIVVDPSKRGATIPRGLYGIFFEEINHAGDGGIYAELIRNRSFEEGPDHPGWAPIGATSIHVRRDRPLNERNPSYLHFEGVGVENGGFWGISARKGQNLTLSLFVRGGGPLRIKLVNAKGEPVASTRIAASNAFWAPRRASLTLQKDAIVGKLTITAESGKGGDLDMVSLFPQETFRRRSNGLRLDLAQAVADLKPSFVRFPGGCFVEGTTLRDAHRWKDTVGPLEQRPGRAGTWGYRVTEGLGYHEYLQWCEDMGAEPLFVANVGMSCQFRGKEVAPMNQMDAWVNDALDAIEYANGPLTSKWGSLRARNGHPRPFGLKLIELGNENFGPDYNQRYALLYDAVRKRYPGVRIIANEMGGSRPTSRPYDLIDEHYYQSPSWFVQNHDRYDRYDRRGPKVYVGEYAVTSDCGLGNLKAAVGEAAFMVGMERNSDVVEMASYAPMFVNHSDRAWNPDMLVFDTHRVYGTPSYFVQKLFANHRGDRVVPTKVSEPASSPAGGRVGFGTWKTQAEFRDVQVRQGGKVVWRAEALGKLSTIAGSWNQEGGTFRQNSKDEAARTLGGDERWKDYTVQLKARKLGGEEGFLILVRARGTGDYIWLNLGGWRNTRHQFERAVGGSRSPFGTGVDGAIDTGVWYDVRVEVSGTQLRAYLNNKLILSGEDRPSPSVIAGASFDKRTGETIVKVVNAAYEPRAVDLSLGKQRATSGIGWQLTSGNPNDENTFDQPLRVSPKKIAVALRQGKWQATLPAQSVTVLRLRSRP